MHMNNAENMPDPVLDWIMEELNKLDKQTLSDSYGLDLAKKYTILWENPVIGGLRQFKNITTGTNYKVFNDFKQAKKFIKKSKFPIYRFISYEMDSYSIPFDFSTLKRWKTIPHQIMTIYIVSYYSEKKLSWFGNMVQQITSKFQKSPGIFRWYLNRKLTC